MKFNYLTAIKRADYPSKSKEQFWLFRCDCGNEKILSKSKVKTGHTKSCGCMMPKLCSDANKKHGATIGGFTKEYSTWCGMRQRCYYKKSNHYYRYGGRGIKVCDRWLESFDNFLEDIGKIPKGYSLERIDNNGNYCPDNCTLIPLNMQKRNTSKSFILTYKCITDSLINLCEKFDKKYSFVYQRIHQGWSIEEAFELPKNSKRNKQ